MAGQPAEFGRLSPAFHDNEEEALVKMEGLNPERARRMLQPRSPSMSPVITVGPHKTGSNALALGVAAADKPTSVKREPSLLRKGGEQVLVHLPKRAPSMTTRAKRPRDHVDGPGPSQQRKRSLSPPTLPPPPARNPQTVYLESLLRPHCLSLTLKSKRDDGSHVVSTQYRSISSVSLILGNVIQDQLDLPILQLPLPGQLNGGLERTVEGELLEGIWYGLAPEAKYSYARQLRHIVNSMRAGINPVRGASTGQFKNDLLGSAFAGSFSLMLDHHAHNTYWVVRAKPACRQFVAFLASSFVSSVPTNVAAALTCQFRSDYAIRFTHGELSPGNIVVQKNKIVCILGWDSGGWYPEWWEYVKFFEARIRPENQDWYEYARHIFADTYPNELVAYQGIARYQRQ